MSNFKQALVSLSIRLVVIAAIAVLDYVSASISSGTFQLPLPSVVVPVLGLIVSEADTWLVNWQKLQQ